VHRRQEIVLLVVQHVVAHGHARRHQLSDAALHQLFGELGVFQLVAYRHPSAGSYQLGQIGVEGVMGEARHFVGLAALAVVATGEGDAQYARRLHGIVAIGFIEIATPEEQQSIGMLCLQVEKLFHHRGELPVFLGHDDCDFLWARRA